MQSDFFFREQGNNQLKQLHKFEVSLQLKQLKYNRDVDIFQEMMIYDEWNSL